MLEIGNWRFITVGGVMAVLAAVIALFLMPALSAPDDPTTQPTAPASASRNGAATQDAGEGQTRETGADENDAADAGDDPSGDQAASEPASGAADDDEAAGTQPTTRDDEASEADREDAEAQDNGAATDTRPSDDDDGESEDDEKISLSIDEMSMQELASFLSKQTGKSVIPQESIRDKEITIVSTKKMTLDRGLQVLRAALRQAGVMMEEDDRIISLRPIDEAAQSNLPMIPADRKLETLKDPSRLVRKTFRVKHADVEQLESALSPMLPEFGGIVTDPDANQIVVTDTVSSLYRIREVIDTLDTPRSETRTSRIFKLENAQPAWLISVLRSTLSSDAGDGDDDDERNRWRRRRHRDEQTGPVTVSTDDGSVLLTPDNNRQWIIALAPSDAMKQIEAWIERLDRPSEGQDMFEMHEIRYANIEALTGRIDDALEAMPELEEQVRVVPFRGSNRLMVFGPKRGRNLVASVLEQTDVEGADNQIMKVVDLEHADAEQVAANIEDLFSNRYLAYESDYSRRYEQTDTADQLHVTANTRRNSLTIVTNPKRMERILAMIEEQWDRPVESEDAQPKTYVLEHADAQRVTELLRTLFSEQSESSGRGFFSYFGDERESEYEPAGRLYGQFNFESMPEANTIVAITGNASNYEAIDGLIEKLDRPQEAGMPSLVELKHANAEDMAARLNATLARPGTLAEIRRSQRTLSNAGETSGIASRINAATGGGGGGGQQGENQQQNDPRVMEFWWSRGEQNPDEQPLSNLIGEIRCVPIARLNAVLVLCPPAYQQPMRKMIERMDSAGAQVIIRAVIAEVQHEDETTLGVRLASNPGLLNDPDLADQAIGGSASGGFNELLAEPFQVGGETFARGIFNADVNVNLLLQLLRRQFDLSILFEPRLYTADNQEAEFFDGQDISVQVSSLTTDEGALSENFVYVPIGTRLTVRPHVTQQQQVKLNVNLLLSRVAGGSGGGNPTFDRREVTTHITVQDGQTVMLSGITRREDFTEVRKLPLLGDLPLLGGLFRNTDVSQRNRELVVFLTPEVVETQAATDEAMEPYRDTLDQLRRNFKQREKPSDPPGAAPEPGASDADSPHPRKSESPAGDQAMPDAEPTP